MSDDKSTNFKCSISLAEISAYSGSSEWCVGSFWNHSTWSDGDSWTVLSTHYAREPLATSCASETQEVKLALLNSLVIGFVVEIFIDLDFFLRGLELYIFIICIWNYMDLRIVSTVRIQLIDEGCLLLVRFLLFSVELVIFSSCIVCGFTWQSWRLQLFEFPFFSLLSWFDCFARNWKVIKFTLPRLQPTAWHALHDAYTFQVVFIRNRVPCCSLRDLLIGWKDVTRMPVVTIALLASPLISLSIYAWDRSNLPVVI